ncbi:hypothetical protein I316_02085 [Kwoniella heveanensis BCC8398]|uniref:Uncharacterized protein n=1 Tax=Kwoniella heveanensis BCC8398 TaxID=1296120 RepID=A0A1B9GYY4_9TREE|nr:hypothetical protein I316_02085 [Kwoniella heveanensis BCC8398]
MEAKVLRCDLLLSMTTRNISLVKSRAAARYTTPSTDEEGKEAAVAEQVEDTETAAPSGSKARLSEEDGSECTNNDIVQPRSPFSEAFDAVHSIKWEDKAEDALVECLIAARHLLEEGRPEVLSLEVQAVDWFGPEGIVSPKQETLEAQKLKSPSRGPRFSDLTSDPEQDQSDLDSEDEEETSEDGSIDIGGSSRVYPLKALFRLHDRYEEQRLAVWLHLPASKREKMGYFMCGLERRVGSAWDGFGLALLMVYDSATLIRHGLGADKLDKWIELAAVKNTKKVRRKPARKTI